MDLKNLLGKLDQLNEAEMTSRKVAGKAYGGSAQADDEDDEDGEKKPAAPVEKRGRGRPRKVGGEAETSAKYGGAAELQRYIVGSVPKKSKELEKLGKTKHKLSDKEPEKKKVKESLKDWIAELDQLMEAEQLTIEPAKASTQVIKQGTRVLGQVSNPQLAATIKQAIGKGEMSLAGTQMREEALDEKWDAETKVSPEEKGKYEGKSKAELLKAYNALKKSGPHKKGSPEFGKMRELAFAIRAKSGWGKVAEADIYSDGMNSMGAGLGAGRSDSTLEAKQGVAEGLAKDIKRAVAGWGAFDKDKPADVVKRVKGQGTDTLKALSNPGSTGKGSPAELQQKAIRRELKKRGEQGVAEGSDVTDYNPKSQGGTRKELLAKYHKTKDPKDAEAARRAGATQKELQGVAEGKSSVKHDDKAEKAGKKVAKDIEYDEKVKDKIHGKKRHAEDEKAERAGKKVAKDIEYDEKKSKKKVDEGMDQRMKAAHHRGKAHALAKEGYNCRYDEGSEEARMYHEGYKMGLDECYGIMPMRGVVVGEGDMEEGMMGAALGGVAGAALGKTPSAAITGARLGSAVQDQFAAEETEQDIVDDMASFGALGEDEVDEGWKEKAGVLGTAAVLGLGGMSGAAHAGPKAVDSTTMTSASPIQQELNKVNHLALQYSMMNKDFAKDLKQLQNKRYDSIAKLELAKRLNPDAKNLRRDDSKFEQQVDQSYVNGVKDLLKQYRAMNEGDMEEGNAFTAALAKTPKGGKFTVGGKTFTDKSDYNAKVDEMMMAFEGWDKQLNELLTEGEKVDEGMSISVSKGQQGSPDSVSVTASDAEADKLMALVKQLGVFGAEESHSDYGAPTDTAVHQHGDLEVVDDHDGMMALMKKMSGQDSGEDYADEMDSEMSHDHGDSCEGCGMPSDECQCDHQETCEACGDMMEAGHSCGGREMVDEVESEDQLEFEVAEDNAPDSEEAETTADENAEAEEDAAIAKYRDADKDITVNEEQLDEWANDAGKDGTDTAFMRDIEFMTKTIAGGLNKEKSTGQTTIPVIAGQSSRMGVDGMNEGSLADLKKLSGIK